MGKVEAVCLSQATGTRKSPVPCAVFRIDHGLVGDAHAGLNTLREISLLALESIERFNREGHNFQPGDFAENITTSAICLSEIPVGTRLRVGDEVEIEITQIGKKCHSGCAIYQTAGKCIMPKEGVFARVIHGGSVRPGDGIFFADR